MQTCYRPSVKRSLPFVLLLGSMLLVVGSCQTAPEEIPPGLSQMEMFQRAQEASDEGRYDVALQYYEEFLVRYPEEPGPIVEAEYEIAFIAYKQERYDDAVVGFEAVIGRYDGDDAAELPAWPLVLSEKLLERIDEIAEEEGIFSRGESAEDRGDD
jgi:tetratricopeptide (TPR) repeat protein